MQTESNTAAADEAAEWMCVTEKSVHNELVLKHCKNAWAL